MVTPIVKSYQEHNSDVREELPPEGWVVIDSYHPHSCPWDYYGMCHQRELRRVLHEGGVECLCMYKRVTILRPTGTGPGGSVRFGDNMTPGTYTIAVPHNQVHKANQAIAQHRQAVQAWLNNNGPMPPACRG